MKQQVQIAPRLCAVCGRKFKTILKSNQQVCSGYCLKLVANKKAKTINSDAEMIAVDTEIRNVQTREQFYKRRVD